MEFLNFKVELQICSYIYIEIYYKVNVFYYFNIFVYYFIILGSIFYWKYLAQIRIFYV